MHPQLLYFPKVHNHFLGLCDIHEEAFLLTQEPQVRHIFQVGFLVVVRDQTHHYCTVQLYIRKLDGVRAGCKG